VEGETTPRRKSADEAKAFPVGFETEIVPEYLKNHDRVVAFSIIIVSLSEFS
jgi:hypothetical protein